MPAVVDTCSCRTTANHTRRPPASTGGLLLVMDAVEHRKAIFARRTLMQVLGLVELQGVVYRVVCKAAIATAAGSRRQHSTRGGTAVSPWDGLTKHDGCSAGDKSSNNTCGAKGPARCFGTSGESRRDDAGAT